MSNSSGNSFMVVALIFLCSLNPYIIKVIRQSTKSSNYSKVLWTLLIRIELLICFLFLYVSINNKNSCLTHDKSPVTIITEKHKNKIWCWLGSRDDGRVMFCSLFFSFIFFLVGSQQNVMGKKKNFDGFCLRPNFHFHFHLG